MEYRVLAPRVIYTVVAGELTVGLTAGRINVRRVNNSGTIRNSLVCPAEVLPNRTYLSR